MQTLIACGDMEDSILGYVCFLIRKWWRFEIIFDNSDLSTEGELQRFLPGVQTHEKIVIWCGLLFFQLHFILIS